MMDVYTTRAIGCNKPTRHGQRWRQVEAIKQRLCEEADAGHSLCAFTAVYAQPRRPHSVEQCNKFLQQTYMKLCTRLVHRHNYARPKYAPLMPLLVAFPEKDGKGEIHHHGVLAIHPSLDAKLQPFMPDRGWRALHDQIATSNMREIYDLRGWLDYATPSALALEWQVWHGPKEHQSQPRRGQSASGVEP